MTTRDAWLEAELPEGAKSTGDFSIFTQTGGHSKEMVFLPTGQRVHAKDAASITSVLEDSNLDAVRQRALPPRTLDCCQRCMGTHALMDVEITKGAADTPLGLSLETKSAWTQISTLKEDSILASSGLKRGDRIYTVDGVPIRGAAHAISLMKAASGTMVIGYTVGVPLHGSAEWAIGRQREQAMYLLILSLPCCYNMTGVVLAWYAHRLVKRSTTIEQMAESAPRVRGVAFMIIGSCLGTSIASWINAGFIVVQANLLMSQLAIDHPQINVGLLTFGSTFQIVMISFSLMLQDTSRIVTNLVTNLAENQKGPPSGDANLAPPGGGGEGGEATDGAKAVAAAFVKKSGRSWWAVAWKPVLGALLVQLSIGLTIGSQWHFFRPPCIDALSCDGCPNCGSVATCGAPVLLAPKSEMWPPTDMRTRPYGPSPLPGQKLTEELEWLKTTVLQRYPKPIKQSETSDALTPAEEVLVTMSLTEWVVARAANAYTCEQMVTALGKRARYLQSVQAMGHFMYWGSFDWIGVALERAKNLDALAASEGTGALAPLYCYPVPVKGTMATTDLPSSAGFASLHTRLAVMDADFVSLVRKANGVVFGKTNVPELAHSLATGNYANGLTFGVWGYNAMVGGSSGGSAAAVAAYSAAIALTEDTGGSTNAPAVRNHLFGFDPPKFHYPNGGNPALAVRNDQAGVVARTIDDIIAFDMAVLGNAAAHSAARAAVDRLSNAQIRIGCSDVYYSWPDAPGMKASMAAAVAALRAAGFDVDAQSDTNGRRCHTTNPIEAVPEFETASGSTVMPHFSPWLANLREYLHTYLGDDTLDEWAVMLNGVYDFGTSLSQDWMYGWQQQGCALLNADTPALREAYSTRIPAERADVHNAYFDGGPKKYDLIMGATQICEHITWTDDIEGGLAKDKPPLERYDPDAVSSPPNPPSPPVNRWRGSSVEGEDTRGCDGGVFRGKCLYNCLTRGVTGDYDKSFNPAKFVVPAGLTPLGEPFALHFMARAGPRNPSVASSEWVSDEVGPAGWGLEELYMVKRISDALAASGMGRAEAPLNAVTGLSQSLLEGSGEVTG